MCLCAYMSVSIMKGDDGRAVKQEMKVRNCDKKNCYNLIPAAQHFKPNDSDKKGKMNEY